MRKFIFTAACTLMMAGLAMGQTKAQPKKSAVKKTTATETKAPAVPQTATPSFIWEKISHNFGKIPQGNPVTVTFNFKNNGKEALIITNAQASCGCTTPDWTKEPVAPGKTGFIKATYNAASVGPFSKSITVTSNVGPEPTILSLSGEVEAPAPQPAVQNNN
jgi:hypothetical protein